MICSWTCPYWCVYSAREYATTRKELIHNDVYNYFNNYILSVVNQFCAFSEDSELGRVPLGWRTRPSLSKFGGS